MNVTYILFLTYSFCIVHLYYPKGVVRGGAMWRRPCHQVLYIYVCGCRWLVVAGLMVVAAHVVTSALVMTSGGTYKVNKSYKMSLPYLFGNIYLSVG